MTFDYIETTIPAGMTVAEYRHLRTPRPSRWSRLVHRTRVAS